MAAKRKPDAPIEMALPITPFLDLAFQLLFFFIVIFRPPTAGHKNYEEGELRLSRPIKKSEAAASDPSKVDVGKETHKEEVDIPVALALLLKAHNNPRFKGTVQEVLLTDGESQEPKVNLSKGKRRTFYPVEDDGKWKQFLTEDLVEFKPAPTGEKKVVPVLKVVVDKDIRWSKVVEVMDLCYKQGYQVSFAKSPDDNSAD